MSQNVVYEVKDRVAVVTMQKAPLNICNQAFYSEIADVFEEISSRDDLSCVILTSGLKVFSAGGEFQEIQSLEEMTQEQANTAVSQCTRCMASIYGCKYPVIAAVNGKAIGAGVALTASCDIVVAGEKVTFSVPELTVGFVGASEFMQRLLPANLLRYYYYTGKAITATDLMTFGGILDVVPQERVMERAMEVAKDLCNISPLALRYAKAALNENDDAKLVEKYMNEFSYTLKFARSDDYKEAVQSMIDHRTPHFTGK